MRCSLLTCFTERNEAMSGLVAADTPVEGQALRPVETRQPWSKRAWQWTEKNLTPYLFVLPFFILFAAFGIYPLIYAVNLSFTSLNGSGESAYVGLHNYIFLLTDD